MKIYIGILCGLLLVSCKESATKILWMNQAPLIDYNDAVFKIETSNNGAIENCYVYTGLQGIKLLHITNGKYIEARVPKGIRLFAGPATLLIQTKSNHSALFHFVGAQTFNYTAKDFRSPKTLITDSSLTQQQLIYSLSRSRNLKIVNGEAAVENWNDIAPNQKTYFAQENKKETTFYVEAGSSTDIQLVMDTISMDKQLRFRSNKLLDKYGNTIVDGTRAVLFIKKGRKKIRVETKTKNGIVQYAVPKEVKTPFSLVLEIGASRSNTLYID